MATRLQQPADTAVNLSALEGKNRKSYTLAFKRQVINFYHANAGNISLAAKMFNVDRKMVRSWVEQEDFLRQSEPDGFQAAAELPPTTTMTAVQLAKSAGIPPSTNGTQRKRLDRNFTSGSSARYPELETALTEWWMVQLNRGMDIKSKSLKSQALKLFHELYPHSSDQEFKASTGWLQRFVIRMEASGSLAGGSLTGQLPSSVPDQSVSRRYTGGDTAASTHAKSMNPYMPMDGRGMLQRPAIQQHPALQTIVPSKRVSSEARDRAAPYLVPIKPKPAAPVYEMPVVIPKALHTIPTGSHRRGSDVRTVQEEDFSRSDNDGGAVADAVQYVPMSQQERQTMDRQTKEANRFFADCRELLAYLENLDI